MALLLAAVLLQATADISDLIVGELASVNTDPVSWYAAESACRLENDGHLVSIQALRARKVFEHFPGARYWVGARKATTSGPWQWSDGSVLSYETLSTLSSFVSFDKETFSKAAGGSCAFVHWNAETRQMVLRDASCSDPLPSVCSVSGDLDCAWSQTALVIHDASFGGAVTHTVGISVSNVLSFEGQDIGIGRWVTPTLFMVTSPNNYVCNWAAEFWTTAENEQIAKCGCQKDATTFDLVAAKMDEPECMLDSQRGVTRLAFDRTAVTTGEGMRVPQMAAPIGSTDSTPKKAPKTVPVWVWPSAFVVVGLVSVFAAVGAGQRKEKKDDKSVSGGSCGSGDDRSCENCEICRKFSAETAKRRLGEVHKALQQEFAMPLVVRSTRCDHVGNDHVHVFQVENEFDASSLGALSTVYSRTKPRLPRNTRIHIEHGKKAEVIVLVEDQTTFDDETIAYHYA